MRLAPLIFALLPVLGCDKATVHTSAPTTLPVGTGRIQGRVSFKGKAPPSEIFDVGDASCGCTQITSQGLALDSEGGLADAIVYLDIDARIDGSARPAALLDQVHCQYQPHVLAVQTGQTLMVRSSDPTMHNVHYVPAMNPPRNLSMSSPGEQEPVSFAEPEFIKLRCDVHPWMSAWVGVFGHPYFAVTDSHGRFTIDHIPAGSYVLRGWHELLGTTGRVVIISDGQSISADVALDTSAGMR